MLGPSTWAYGGSGGNTIREGSSLIGRADAIDIDDTCAGSKTAKVLIEAGVEILFASRFTTNTVAAYPQAGARALVAPSERREDPIQTPEQLLDLLVARYGMHQVADVTRPLLTQLR